MKKSPEEVVESAKRLIAEQEEASLGTLEGEIPFVSATSYLFEPGEGEQLGNFYLLLSRLARHTKNLQRNRTVSLLIVENKPKVSIHERVRITVVGTIEEVGSEEERKWLQERYHKRFSWAGILFSLPDFHFYRLRPQEIYWIGGFGQVQSRKLPE